MPEIEIKSNCVGFAYYKLGLRENEAVMSPTRDELLSVFEEVASIDDAQAVAFLVDRFAGEVIAHIAVLNEDRTTVIHRPYYGQPITITPLYLLVFDYGRSNLPPKFLKLKK